MPYIRELKNLRIQCRTLFPAFPVFLLNLAQRSTPWQRLVVACSCWCYAVKLELRCAAAALLSIDGPRLSPHPAWALISSRTGSRTASSAVHFTYPQAGWMCKKCFLMQEVPATEASLHFFCWCMRLVSQLNDLGMNSLLPLSLGTSNVFVF